MSSNALFEHIPHPHIPRNTNAIHEAELRVAGFNERLAVFLTKATSTMTCTYLFVCLALLAFPALSAWLGPLVGIYVVWLSQCFIQLVMLPVLSVGQGVLERKAELQADEQFDTTTKIYHDSKQIAAHLAAQDAELVKQTAMIAKLTERQDIHDSNKGTP